MIARLDAVAGEQPAEALPPARIGAPRNLLRLLIGVGDDHVAG